MPFSNGVSCQENAQRSLCASRGPTSTILPKPWCPCLAWGCPGNINSATYPAARALSHYRKEQHHENQGTGTENVAFTSVRS